MSGPSSFWVALAMTVSACDDPAPVVLGRLVAVRDAGESRDGGEHDQDREQHDREHDADQEEHEHEESSERE